MFKKLRCRLIVWLVGEDIALIANPKLLPQFALQDVIEQMGKINPTYTMYKKNGKTSVMAMTRAHVVVRKDL